MSQPQTGRNFQPQEQSQFIGLRIHGLPESCTNELLYHKIFQNLKIETNKVKAFKVRGNKDKYNCLGDAFVYFDSEENAQDAMGKIIGTSMHQNELNCSFLMPAKDLKLKNSKNVHVKSLRSDVSLKSFYTAMRAIGQVHSVILNRNKKTDKLDGYACFKTEAEALKLDNTEVVIKDHKYLAKLLVDKAPSQKVPQNFNFGGLSRNIKLEFESPLTELEPINYENAIRNQIEEKFSLQPVSVFVWGKNARHMNNNSSIRVSELVNGEGRRPVDKCQESTTGFVADQAGDCGAFDCYLDPHSNCPRILNARSKAFVTFATDKEASTFVNQFYSKGSDLTSYVFGDQTVTLKVCLPNTKDPQSQELIRNKIGLFPQKDKSFVYLGNIREDVDQKKIKEEIEKVAGTEVLTIKIIKSAPRERQPAPSYSGPSKSDSFLYATLHLKDASKSDNFIAQFKQDVTFRKQFDSIFCSNYKYANFLTPIKIRQNELKEKKRGDKQKKFNTNQRGPYFQQAIFSPFQFINNNLNMNMQNMNNFQNKGPRQNQTGGQLSFQQPYQYMPAQFGRGGQISVQGQNFPVFPPQQYPRNNSYPQSQQRGQNNYSNFGGQAGSYNNNASANMNNENARTLSEGRPNYANNTKGNSQTQSRRYNSNPQHKGQAPHGNASNKPTGQDQRKNNIQKPAFAPEKKGPTQAPVQPPPAPIKQQMAPAQFTVPQVLVLPKLEDIIRKTDEEKRSILGQHLYPKIMAIITDDQKTFVPKITGMLLDFDVFTLQEIYELIENTTELQEQIKDALDLIQESTTQ